MKEVFDLLVNHRVPFLAILDFVACAAPYCLAFTLPWGFLTAVFLVFGRMAADKELFALHISGIPIGRVCRTVFIIATGFCLFSFSINAEINPRARQRMKNMLHTLAVSALLNDSSTDRIVSLSRRRIYIGSQDARHLKNIQIYEFNEASELGKIVFARQGWLESKGDQDELLIHLEDVTTDERDPVDVVKVRLFRLETTAREFRVDSVENTIRPTDAKTRELDLENDSNVPTFHRGMAVREYTYRISLFELINKYSSTNARLRALGSYTLTGLGRELKDGMGDTLRVSAFLTEFNKRIAISLACLTLALTGVPLAIMCQRRETTVGFGLGLVLASLYYGFFLIADNVRGNPAVHPELLTWASNCLFIPIGGVLFWRLGRR